jgi:hypothetical protein
MNIVQEDEGVPFRGLFIIDPKQKWRIAFFVRMRLDFLNMCSGGRGCAIPSARFTFFVRMRLDFLICFQEDEGVPFRVRALPFFVRLDFMNMYSGG